MDIYYYSPSTQGFYALSLYGNLVPEDALLVANDLYKELIVGQCHGNTIMPPDGEHVTPWLQESKLVVKTLEEHKAGKLQKIIEETEAAIIAGFEYAIKGKRLYFSYQYNDQQNFSDTANMATFAKMGVKGVPDAITWNGWLVEKDSEDKEVDRSLIPVTLSNDEFLALYMQGALAHKARQMAVGSERKAKVETATTIEELEGI